MPNNYFDYVMVPNNETGTREKRYVRDQEARNSFLTKADLENGKVPAAQLPSYVDDVLEYNSISDFPTTGEANKIYIDKTTNITYRWGGSGYVEIASSLALGETDSTAYRGDRGKIAYDHAFAKGAGFVAGLYKIATNIEGHVTDATSVQKSDITNLGIPAQDTTYDNATESVDGLMSAADKTKLNSTVSCTVANVKTALGTTSGTTMFLREDGTWAIPSSSGSITPISDAEIDALFV